MKKITLLFCLLIFTAGFAQTDMIENFDGTAPSLAPDNGDCAPNFIGMNITTAQAVSGPNSLEIIAQAAGNPWQGAQVIPQGISGMELTTNKNMTVDVYSLVPVGVLAKVTGGTGPDGTSAANHTGSGWETLSYNFADMADGATIADGIYPTIRFYPLWGTAGGYAGQGSTPCVSNAPVTIYIDNIMGTLPTGPTCSDGIQNQGETGIDCGGPCSTCGPSSAPTSPGVPDNLVYSIYNDTEGYTTNFPFAYPFGGGFVGEVDLDPGAGVNNAWRFDLGIGGYGQGEETTTGAINAYTHVSFDYWLTAPTNPAATGTGFRFVLISDNTNPVSEGVYEIGTDEAAVVETWTTVSIPLTAFGGGFDQAEFFQWKLDPFGQSVDNDSELFLDNVIFTTGDVLSVGDNNVAEFSVYPNPTKNNWNIKASSTINSVVVFDILGKQVTTLTPNSTDVEISTANINAGVYFAKIESANGSKTVKLIKE
jgi:Secretion system C-terminal sorting domain